jgi:hypothetical protein
MKFSNIALAAVAQFNAPQGNRVVPYIEGKPGGGKSALGRQIGIDLGIEPANIHQFFASLREPVDLMGIPKADDAEGISRWFPPEEIHKLATGRNLLILEELSDANVPMQNALCGLIHDRRVGSVHLSPETYIVATGNRTKDKSGATRIISKLGGRVRRFQFEENIDEWTNWALSMNIDLLGIQFLRFRPGLLSDFNPDNFSSPTPRTWEKAFMTPTNLPKDVFLESLQGDVGDGAAAEYVGFREVASEMPDVMQAIMNPAGCEIPTKPAVLYAFTGAVAHKTTKDNFDRVSELVDRMSPEFGIMLVNDATKLHPDIKSSRAFVAWAVKNASLFM